MAKLLVLAHDGSDHNFGITVDLNGAGPDEGWLFPINNADLAEAIALYFEGLNVAVTVEVDLQADPVITQIYP